KRILILSSNPKGTSRLRLDEEVREIKEGLRRARAREHFSVETAEAVRYRDIHRAILDYEPHILHFSGHGAGEEGLVFENETGNEKLVDAEALGGLFQLFADQLECVVLNACYSKVQAEEIAKHINYVIGMSQAIKDKAAIEFAVGFYDALGAGRPVEFAYKLGCWLVRVAEVPGHLIPQLLTKNLSDDDSQSLARAINQKFESSLELNTEVELHSEKEADYTRLRDLLAAGKWKDADQETARVMLLVAGQKQRGFLRQEDIENFPCTDLRTIDQLWVTYSNGCFGFSVQKKIWLEAGGKLDYETECKLGDQLGWRKGGEWNYYNITFKLQPITPFGQLPVAGFIDSTQEEFDLNQSLGVWFGFRLVWRLVLFRRCDL
ncbi:MAG: CHAT domain-containing protein, partial [Symploca sp. SIO2G7]|nr:CHAT domain-containing protein [Symploca sp. SIO2G7]